MNAALLLYWVRIQGGAVAISFAFSLFLAVREKRLAVGLLEASAPKLTVVDVLLRGVLFVCPLGLSVPLRELRCFSANLQAVIPLRVLLRLMGHRE